MELTELLPNLIRQLPFGVCVIDRDYQVVLWNDFFSDRLSLPESSIRGQALLTLFPEQAPLLKKKIDSVFVLNHSSFSYWEQRPHIFRFQSSRPITGEETIMYQNLEVMPLQDQEDNVQYACIIIHDVTVQASYYQELQRVTAQLEIEHHAQKELIQKLEETQGQLLQSEKLASIGQLAAGVAHEINNPIGYINSNIQSLKSYIQAFAEFSGYLEKLIDGTKHPRLIDLKDKYCEKKQIRYISEDIKELINESLEGTERVMSIVRSLKDFSHVDSSEWCYADIVQGIENTLKIIWHEVKYKSAVHKEYQPGIPQLYCQPMQLNQVFMNLLINAAQAIEQKGDIYIAVRQLAEQGSIEIRIRDNGCGIPEEHQKKIFEPFYTTKPVGSGTGLGLSLSYGIIKKHRGKIIMQSQPGVGTEFTIRLPFLEPSALADGNIT